MEAHALLRNPSIARQLRRTYAAASWFQP